MKTKGFRRVFDLFLLGVVLILAYACSVKQEERLPILGRKEVQTKMVEGKEVLDTVYHTIENFSFINQDSIVITQERSEEHTSELQSRENLVCRLLLEKKKKN